MTLTDPGLVPLTRTGLDAAGLAGEYLDTDYASLSAAVTAIGATVATLIISTPNFPNGATCTVPATLTLEFVGNGSILMDTGETVTINSDSANWPIRKLFYNAQASQGTIKLLGRITDVGYLEWWGASPTASAAGNTPAIQAAIQSMCLNGTNGSGLWIYNRTVKFLGMYDINDKLDVFHMIGFRWEGQTKFNSGINQTATNKVIVAGESVAYGVFNQLKFITSASQNAALVELDYSGAQGDDLRPQNITFQDCVIQGNDVGFIGVRIAKSGGGAQGDNVRFYACYFNGFTEAGLMLGHGADGVSTSGAFNAIHIQVFGGDIQGCPKYGIEIFSGSILMDGTTFENGNFTFADGAVQTGCDIYSYSSQNPNVIKNVRSESIRFAAGNSFIIENCSIIGPLITYDNAGWAALPGTTGFTNKLVTGTPYGGDGKMYVVQAETPVVDFESIVAPFSTTVITDTAASYGVDALAGMYLRCRYPNCFESGYSQIASNTATTITLSSALPFIPGDGPGQECGPTSTYEVIAALPIFGGLQDQTATSGSDTTIVKTSAGWTVNAFAGQKVTIMSGAGKYQYGVITSNTSDTITCSAGWVTDYTIIDSSNRPVQITNPASGSHFVVEPNWNGGSLTSGTVDLVCFDFNTLDGITVGAGGGPFTGFDGSVNGFYAGYGGQLKVIDGSTIRRVTVTRQDWIDSGMNLVDSEWPKSRVEDVTVRRPGAATGERLPWSIPRHSYTNTFLDISQNQRGKEWDIWSQGDFGGGDAHLDVGIGRADGVTVADGNATSRNVLGILGTLGRKTASGTDQAGTALNVQGGLSTGSGAAGPINFYIGAAGSTGQSVNPGAIAAGVGPNRISWSYKGADVASAATIAPTGNLFHVTGTTNITSVSGTGITAGTVIMIIFDGVLTFTNGGNLVLAGNFVTTANDTITLAWDGTSWFERCRSIN